MTRSRGKSAANATGAALESAPATDVLGARRDEIADRRAMLVRRLDDGYQRIDAALADGQDIGRWEDFWLELLLEYEALCGPLDHAA